ncbi:MAG: hypothetical protein ACRD50_07265 [Candidatus Acidiferrales bacterium]
MSDEELIAQFENGAVPGESFHHHDHVRMAFLYLCHYPPLEAIGRFSGALARIATANGKPGLYNETVTWGFLLLVRERMIRAGNRQSWDEFAAGNADLLNWKDNVLRRYYRDETLFSELAKKTFLLPDRALTARD